jgi:nascent polypeptide-associated complex subunit beta
VAYTELQELLPGILNQMGPDSLQHLKKMMAQYTQGMAGMPGFGLGGMGGAGAAGAEGGDDDGERGAQSLLGEPQLLATAAVVMA